MSRCHDPSAERDVQVCTQAVAVPNLYQKPSFWDSGNEATANKQAFQGNLAVRCLRRPESNKVRMRAAGSGRQDSQYLHAVLAIKSVLARNEPRVGVSTRRRDTMYEPFQGAQ